MSRAERALIVLVVASLGVWGCAQGPTNGAASAERLRALETKIAKLEDDFRAAVAVRDQLRKKLTAADQQIEQLQAVVKERDELRQQRDAVQNQFDQFRRGIKTLLGQAEPSNGPTVSPTVPSADSTAGKS